MISKSVSNAWFLLLYWFNEFPIKTFQCQHFTGWFLLWTSFSERTWSSPCITFKKLDSILTLGVFPGPCTNPPPLTTLQEEWRRSCGLPGHVQTLKTFSEADLGDRLSDWWTKSTLAAWRRRIITENFNRRRGGRGLLEGSWRIFPLFYFLTFLSERDQRSSRPAGGGDEEILWKPRISRREQKQEVSWSRRRCWKCRWTVTESVYKADEYFPH